MRATLERTKTESFALSLSLSLFLVSANLSMDNSGRKMFLAPRRSALVCSELARVGVL